MHLSRIRSTAAAAVLLVVTACGGGDGGGSNGGGGGGMPANQAPRFTSAAAVSVPENSVGSYQATATDPNGDSLTFSIAGGADAGKFVLTGAGLLQFASAPNYELPT